MRISDWSSDVCSSDLAVAGLDVAGFLQQPGAWRTVVDLVGIGLFTGFFVVPLFALIQSRSPKSEMSRTFAALNIQKIGRASCRERVVQYVLMSVVAVSLKQQTTNCIVVSNHSK